MQESKRTDLINMYKDGETDHIDVMELFSSLSIHGLNIMIMSTNKNQYKIFISVIV